MIRIENVTKAYGSTVAVDNLSLTVAPGELFGLLGPNGAGKTTTLKMLAGLLVPDSGSLAVDGADLATDAMAAKAVIGYVPDKPYVYEKLTGAEFLEFVTDIYHVRDDPRTAETQKRLMVMFGLSEWMNELVESYSHGMRQKLIITAALSHHPKALIIDEPMVGLDARGMRQVKELFGALCAEGRSVLLSTHTMSIAQEVCHRIGVLSHGKLIAIGSMEELRQRAGGADDDLESIFLRLTEAP